jgi:DNA mismatch repair protein MutS
VAAAGAVLQYVVDTQKDHLRHINTIEWYETKSYLMLDDIAKRNLELFPRFPTTEKRGLSFI